MQPRVFRRSGTRRAGDDDQDALAVDICVDWLEHPSKYGWIELEASGAGALDDVVAMRIDGRLRVTQIKYAVYLDDEDATLGWDDLLARPSGVRGANRSLLQKW